MKVGCASDTDRKRRVNEDRYFFDANRGLFTAANGVEDARSYFRRIALENG